MSQGRRCSGRPGTADGGVRDRAIPGGGISGPRVETCTRPLRSVSTCGRIGHLGRVVMFDA
jgi:hypothetical protein